MTNTNSSTSFSQSQSLSPPSLNLSMGVGMGVGLNCNVLPYTSHYSAKICLKSAFAIARSFTSLPYPQPVRRSLSSPNSIPQQNQGQNQIQMEGQDPYSYFSTMSLPITTSPYARHSLSPQLGSSISNSNSGSVSGPLGPGNANPAPRMIPVFACCAMQSSYALIMLSYKTKAMGFAGPLSNNSNGNKNDDGNGAKENQAQKLLGQLSEGLHMILGALRNYSVAYEALGGMRGLFFLPLIPVYLSWREGE